ncbi:MULTISPECIES: fimbrial protein [Serratia]|uniref:fimbrial protein n=1 Tax=Serratia TaxID=613 RepID=UPI00131695EF|nr:MULTISPECIES: fimbrial protein [Serratia]MDI3150634.1 fimbrial protein [Serratia nevei]QHC47750.1 type 1 fimbrial protein [Serratia marcescens]
MKRHLGLALTLYCLSSLAYAADNLRFSGALVAEPCVIPPGQETIALDFGSVVDKYLYTHQRTPGMPFEINLAECDLSLGKTVTLTLRGQESLALPGLLAPENRNRGIAIGLETPAGDALAINHPSGQFRLSAGRTAIELRAYVQAEPAMIADKKLERGAFNAIATFNLEYQ